MDDIEWQAFKRYCAIWGLRLLGLAFAIGIVVTFVWLGMKVYHERYDPPAIVYVHVRKIDTLPELKKNPSRTEVETANKFMARRCHFELSLVRTHTESLKVYRNGLTYSEAWPDAISTCTCMSWILKGEP